MPDDAPSRRSHLDRQSYAERFARGDSYGLLLALLVVPLPPHRRRRAQEPLGTLHRSAWSSDVVLLLAFHTSHVRARAFRVGIVLVVIADLANLIQAVDRTRRRRRLDLHHVRAGAAGADRDPQPDPPARDGRARDDPRRRSASTCSSRIAFAGIYGGDQRQPSRPASSPSRSCRTTSTSSTSVRHAHHGRVRRPHRGHEHGPRAS